MSDEPPAHSNGWYPDPTWRHRLRYFDGGHWTDHVADGEDVREDALGPLPSNRDAWLSPQVMIHVAESWKPFKPVPSRSSGRSEALAALIGAVGLGGLSFATSSDGDRVGVALAGVFGGAVVGLRIAMAIRDDERATHAPKVAAIVATWAGAMLRQ